MIVPVLCQMSGARTGRRPCGLLALFLVLWFAGTVSPGRGAAFHDDEPFIATDGGGNWLTVWTARPADGGGDSDIVFSRSLDDAVT